jgi:hypothetical protein
MEKIYFEYLKSNDIKEELEIEEFWLNIRKEIFAFEEDHSLVYYNLRRGHASAYIGEYAGTFIQILLTVVPFIDATLSIWEKIDNHIKSKRGEGKIIRILNLTTLINLCKVNLYLNQSIKNVELKKAEKLVDIDIQNYNNPDLDFPYEDTLNKVNAAKITFEDKNHKYIYIIDSDGEITSFVIKKK